MLFLTGPPDLSDEAVWSVPIGAGILQPPGGPLGTPGTGGLTITGSLPSDAALVGEVVHMHMVIVADLLFAPGGGAGPAAPPGSAGLQQGGFGRRRDVPDGGGQPRFDTAVTNGVAMTIVDGS